MKSVRLLVLGFLAVAIGCDEDPLTSERPDLPPAPRSGIQAFLQVSNDHAAPGDRVRVFVRVQIGSRDDAKLGSYTGALRFDPETLAWDADVSIDDGLRLTNPEAGPGLIRFAGAAARGLNDPTLYHGEFVVKDVAYMDGLRFEMEELTAALSLDDMTTELEQPPEIFLRTAGN